MEWATQPISNETQIHDEFTIANTTSNDVGHAPVEHCHNYERPTAAQ